MVGDMKRRNILVVKLLIGVAAATAACGPGQWDESSQVNNPDGMVPDPLVHTMERYLSGPCTAFSLASSPAAGSTVNAGSTVDFSATASCGTGTLEYVFRGYTAAGGWKTLKRWSTSNTFSWDTTSAATGVNKVMAWVRVQGSGVAYQALSEYLLYTLQ